MARSGPSPPRYSRLDTDPDDATLSSPGPAGSPACRDSPWSVGASALSSSPTSTTFLSLAGAAAGTPLSSLDGEEPASRIAADGTDKMENESLLAWAEPQRSQKGEASSVASAPSAPRSPAMAQSPERNRGQHAPQAQHTTQNTRLRNSLLPSNSTPSATSVSAASVPVSVPPLVRPSFTTAPPPPESPAIVRTTSSHGDLPLRHPVPDPNARSDALVGNVAQLEASAEQLAQFDSIEDAIREAHEELKRSDSRRSSLLAASVRRANSSRAASDTTDPASVLAHGPAASATSASHRPPRPQLLRAYSGHDSIIELNSAARSGGFSPHDYIMSPASSLAGSILQRTASNGSASGSVHGSTSGANFLGISDQSITAGGDDYFPFLSRHGTGKSSMRSVRSGKISLPEIAELEPPTTLTQAALDEADRVLAAGLPDDDNDHTLRFADHLDTWPEQHIAASTDPGTSMPPPPPAHITPARQPYSNPQEAVHDRDNPMGQDAPAYHLPEQAANGGAVAQYDVSGQERPTTSGSGATFEQAQHAFRDFDGVHCDPDEAADQVPELPRYANPSAANEAQPPPPPVKSARPQQPPPRPTSYMDPATGRQMLFYPAPVPAMLQLPAKLSRSTKAAERRSQVMSMMVQARQEPTLKHERQSWLPDLTTGSDIGSLPYNRSGSLVPDGLSSPSHSASQHGLSVRSDGGLGAENGPTSADVQGEGPVRDDGQQQARTTMNLRRPSRILDADKRKSRMPTALDKLPPQLRASAYFDLPATTAGASIEAKNGSAMDTLDSILDAAAHAPISAFTDHAFAGHLGAEVYGGTKKRNRKKANSLTLEQLTGATAAAEKDARAPQLRASRSRSSFFGLVGNIRKVSASVDGHNDGASDAGRVVSSSGRLQRHRSQNLDRDGALTPGLSDGGSGLMAPDDDERLSDEEEEDRLARARGHQPGKEEEEEDDEGEDDGNLVDGYLGAPTTLLAELQLRKQQQKQRTRPITSAFPNGMHSTLLELDAVAEVERKTRRVKKVNLAWEDPDAAHDGDEDMDNDEDVPLGLLYAAKAAGHNDVVAASADLSRPLGLMEKKELEDNEPLSRRRDRLQGRDPGAVSMYLSSGNALKRQSVLALKPISPGHGSGSAVAGADAGSDASEVEDEPLAVRRNRVKARRESELPLARPVSTAFSAELLSQFGDLEVGKDEKDAFKQENASRRPEEEETLGQRRRRLQSEKGAREQEMMGGGGGGGSSGLAVNDQALHALTGSTRLSRRLSMADLLSAAPAGPAKGGQPTGAKRGSRMPSSRTMTMSQADLGRAAPGQWGAMGMMGSASAAHLPSMGSMGGHMGVNMGPQNGMMGGAVPYGGVGMNGMGGMMGMNNNPYGNTMAGGFMPGYNGGFGGFGGRGMPLQMPMGTGMPMQMQMPMGMQRQMPVQMGTMQPPQVQIDRVERWRQGVYP